MKVGGTEAKVLENMQLTASKGLEPLFVEFVISCQLQDRIKFDRFPGFQSLYGLPLFDQTNQSGQKSAEPRVLIPKTGVYSINWGGHWDDLNISLRIATLPAHALSEHSRQSVFQSLAVYWPISPTPDIKLVSKGHAKIQPVKLELVKGDYVWVDAQRAGLLRNTANGEVLQYHNGQFQSQIDCWFRVKHLAS